MNAEADRWIIVKGWEKFQHRDAFRSRTPTWIKVFTDLHHKDEWLNLSPSDRAAVVGIWIEFSLARGQLSNNTAQLSRRLNQRITNKTLERLSGAGFIRISARKPASIDASKVARPDLIRFEEKPPKPPLRGNGTNSNGRAFVCDHDGLAFPSEKRLLEHRRNVHDDIPLPTPEAAA